MSIGYREEAITLAADVCCGHCGLDIFTGERAFTGISGALYCCSTHRDAENDQNDPPDEWWEEQAELVRQELHEMGVEPPDDEGAFVLDNDPPQAPRLPIAAEKHRQTALFAGLDCCPDQQDLFQTDGGK